MTIWRLVTRMLALPLVRELAQVEARLGSPSGLALRQDLPSWTIQAQPGPATGPFHWTNRRLAALEMCRLQTFPDGIDFDCRRNEIQKMLGSAVPSLLAEVLARGIRLQLLKHPCRGQLKLLPPAREPVPDQSPLCQYTRNTVT